MRYPRSPRQYLSLPGSCRVSLILLMWLVVLAGCGSSTASGSGRSGTPASTTTTTATPGATIALTPTALQAVRFSGGRERIAPFEQKIDNAVAVSRLYTATLALKPIPDWIACPIDLGGGTQLNFMNGDKILMQGTLWDGGCPRITLSSPHGCRVVTPAYWQLVASTLGVTVAGLDVIEDSAPPNGAVAPRVPLDPILPASCIPGK